MERKKALITILSMAIIAVLFSVRFSEPSHGERGKLHSYRSLNNKLKCDVFSEESDSRSRLQTKRYECIGVMHSICAKCIRIVRRKARKEMCTTDTKCRAQYFTCRSRLRQRDFKTARGCSKKMLRRVPKCRDPPIFIKPQLVVTPPTRAELIFQRLSTNVTQAMLLSDEVTPQGQAYKWIVQEDEMRLKPDDKNLEQRFILSVLYFATNGDGWNRCYRGDKYCNRHGSTLPFLSNQTECEWYGIDCDGDMTPKPTPRPTLTPSKTPTKFPTPNPTPKGPTFNPTASPTKRTSSAPTKPTNPPTGTQTRRPTSFPTRTTTANGNVVSILLGGNNIIGPIPNELLHLPFLQQLDLSRNPIGGRLPSFESKTLTDLHLQSCSLIGEIENLNLPSLLRLHLESNRIVGASNLNVPKLRVLEFSRNRLIAFKNANISSLQELRMNANQLNGPLEDLIQMLPTNMASIDLSSNSITGTVPDRLGEFTNLELLFLHENELSGIMPDKVCALKNASDHRRPYLSVNSRYSDCPLPVECDCCDRQRVCPTPQPTNSPTSSTPPSVSLAPSGRPTVSQSPSVSPRPTSIHSFSYSTSSSYGGSYSMQASRGSGTYSQASARRMTQRAEKSNRNLRLMRKKYSRKYSQIVK